MHKPFYKKIDRSMLEWGVTFPEEYIEDFGGGKLIEPGTSRKVQIIWDNKKYFARLSNVKRKKYKPVYQLRWDNNKEFLNKLRKTFIQSYIILKSQKELFDIDKKGKKYFRSKFLQEALKIRPINDKQIKFEVFIKIETEWNNLFERLAEENVFGWLFNKNKKYLISKSVNWHNVKDFNKHSNAVNVIYYLANTKKRLLYIGKAENFGNRVKPGRKHQNMPEDWNKFRYDIVKPEYSNILEKIEDHTIRAFASILENNKNYPSLQLGFKLVNANWRKL